MAKVVVEGTVSRINSRGNGYGLKESESFNGSTKTRYWSVFPPKDAARDVVEGQVVKLEGFLGTRVSERDNRYVDHTLNGARVVATPAAEPAAPVGGGSDDAWAPAPSYGDDTPF